MYFFFMFYLRWFAKNIISPLRLEQLAQCISMCVYSINSLLIYLVRACSYRNTFSCQVKPYEILLENFLLFFFVWILFLIWKWWVHLLPSKSYNDLKSPTIWVMLSKYVQHNALHCAHTTQVQNDEIIHLLRNFNTLF